MGVSGVTRLKLGFLLPAMRAYNGITGAMPLKLPRTLISKLAAAVLLGILPGASALQSAPLRITTSADIASARLAAGPDERLFFACNRPGQSIWLSVVHRDIRTHFLEIAASGAVAPAVAATPDGRAHVAYSQGWEIRHRSFDPATGQAGSVAIVSAGTGGSNRPALATDASGNLHAVWTRDGNIWYNRLAAGSSAWGTPTQISFTGDLEPYLSPGITTVGVQPVIIWGRTLGGQRSIWLTSRESGGWATTQLPGPFGQPSGCQVAADGEGNLFAAWDDGFDVHVQRRVSGIWGTRQTIRSGAAQSFEARVVVRPNGQAQVFWRDNGSGFWDIWQSEWNGAMWSAPSSATGLSSGGCVAPDAGVHSSGGSALIFSNAWDIWLVRGWQDTTAPPAAAELTATPGDGQALVRWRNPDIIDADTIRINWSTAGPPVGPYDGSIAVNRQALGTLEEQAVTGLPNNTIVWLSVFLRDRSGNWSQPSSVSVNPSRVSCGSVKALPDGSVVTLAGRVVTAIFPGDSCYYIADPDRASAIRIAAAPGTLQPGLRVDIQGRMGSRRTPGGMAFERQILPDVVAVSGSGDALAPLGIAGRGFGGGPSSTEPGVRGAEGLGNVGQLVRITGRVSYASGMYFFLDDGGGLPNLFGAGTSVKGVMVRAPGSVLPVAVGDTASVTGIVVGSVPSGWEQNRALLWMRGWQDLAVQP